MDKIKEHLEKSRAKLHQPGTSINKAILDALADIHTALDVLTNGMYTLSEDWDTNLEEKSKHLESRAKFFTESLMNDMYGLVSEVEETKTGMVELESSMKRWRKIVDKLAEENEKMEKK